MNEEKFPCFGSHKVILVEGSAEEDSLTFTINPDCEDCPQIRAYRRKFLSGEGRYILDHLSEPPSACNTHNRRRGSIRTVTMDYGLTDRAGDIGLEER